ncbi:hypothetical protein [Actinoplanes sp. DH11]|uniref:hypothetical protein n=1 Tax=Actinoplanes sp. DH11 TaxID=2857011 RepID=UPI001E29CE76|nr:hypothetical protein [Actinoplanes sp. DH11]
MGERTQPGRAAWLFLSIALALASGAAQLVASGPGRAALLVICAVSVVLLLGGLARHAVVVLPARMAREREALREALSYLVDTADAPFAEAFHLTMNIGADNAGDTVRCEVLTSPEAPLRYRSFSPVIGGDGGGPAFGRMNFSARVLSPENVHVEVMPIRTTGRMRVLALFRPAVHEPCRWVTDYVSPGLWRPLREQGHDELTWRIRERPDGVTDSGTDMAVTFVPPPGRSVAVTERSGRGVLSVVPDTAGRQCTTWRNPGCRSGDVFVFQLSTMRPGHPG